MRKLVKEQLQEEVSLLEQANFILENPGEDVNSGQLLDLLAQEQELAISIGSRIEETEGAGTRAVALLEEYCEELWHLSQELVGEHAGEHSGGECVEKARKAAGQTRLAKLQELIGQIRAQIHGLPRQYDVVFLPYKASMWDSLESVWMAADRDPDCNCYVIPIPYCDLNSDGSIGQVHYEASLMPSYVPVTHYEAYDIKENRPDIIYIHNPYDGSNMVTRVAAEFYSEELKKYTDMLVYIPYYLGTQHLAEEHKLLSAYLHADKIILQNETMVEDVHSSIPREKLAALGNPKADRILRLEEEKSKVIGQMVPKAWKKKIKGKKVVLYNISISGILQFSEQALDKIRYVLSRFEGREDVVLLWRPHPLIESTLKSMRPALYEGYMQIKRQFIADDYGILDETPDVGVSVVISDAYVGEESSSLVNYFGVLGKPVFFTDWKLTEEWNEDERASVWFSDCFFEDNCAWFVPKSDLGYQYLCRMDLKTGEIWPAEELPGEINNPVKGRGYFAIVKVNESIVLTPFDANDIYIYRLNTKQAVKVPLRYGTEANFTRAYEYGGKVFLQPKSYPEIIELDVDTGHCVYHRIPPVSGAEALLGLESAGCENEIYIPYADRKAILIFHMDTGAFSEKTLDHTEGSYSFLTRINNELWAVGERTSEIVCWDMASDVVNVWNDFPEGYVGGEYPLGRIFEDKDGVIILPRTSNMAVKVRRNASGIAKYTIQDSFSEGDRESDFYKSTANYRFSQKLGDKLIAVSSYNHSLIVHDTSTGQYEIYPCRLKADDRKKMECLEIDGTIKKGQMISSCMESKRWSLSVFLDYIAENVYDHYGKARKNYQSVSGKLDGRCGDAVHDLVKSESEMTRSAMLAEKERMGVEM